MGRVKLEMKKIENKTSRQVTFSKRRNGLIKKAYELSVLCDVDVALIMFSPAGKLSLFSSNNRSVEEILARYANLPGNERVGDSQILSINSNQIEEIEQEIVSCKSQLKEMKNLLRMFEGGDDLSKITTLHEAEYREQILEETLKRLQTHKQVVEGYNSCAKVLQPPPVTPHNILGNCLPLQSQILNSFNANGLLPLSDDLQTQNRLSTPAGSRSY